MSRFTITYRDGGYYVSIPNYGGGEVVSADVADELLAELVDARERLLDAHKNGYTRANDLFPRINDAIAQATGGQDAT